MNNAVFPFSFTTHLIFAIFCAIFFMAQYARLKYKYHIIMAFAIPLSLLVYIAENKVFFYAIGITELVLLIVCAVNISVERKKLDAMHTIRETMRGMDGESVDKTKETDEIEPGGLVEISDFSKNEDVSEGWLDTLAKNTAPQDDKTEEKPKQLRTGWVDMDFKD
ncbi:MAG: hypothetical protein LBM93_02260 [Oscillospiraceae bacterium]|jgi:hypothetical protein|nr:hypothetical protein [Oscillospiraceae bacterium]